MAKLPKVPVVIVGMGWVGGIIAAELTKAGIQVVGLERGKNRSTEDYFMDHDELRYARRFELMQDLSKETITFRNSESMRALPMRSYGSFLLGDGLGGAGTHWNGQTHRFLPYDFEIFSKTVERYGKGKIPEGMQLQDWGITYDEIEPYYDKFEQMAKHFRGIGSQSDAWQTVQSVSDPADEENADFAKVRRGVEEARIPSVYDPFGQPEREL